MTEAEKYLNLHTIDQVLEHIKKQDGLLDFITGAMESFNENQINSMFEKVKWTEEEWADFVDKELDKPREVDEIDYLEMALNFFKQKLLKNRL